MSFYIFSNRNFILFFFYLQINVFFHDCDYPQFNFIFMLLNMFYLLDILIFFLLRQGFNLEYATLASIVRVLAQTTLILTVYFLFIFNMQHIICSTVGFKLASHYMGWCRFTKLSFRRLEENYPVVLSLVTQVHLQF